ncbi:MAG: peptide-methionine (S)-S-oxide reductase MsrA [Acidobacteriota bacterium]
MVVAAQVLLAAGWMCGASFPDPPGAAPAVSAPKKATVVLAGGCFWGMEGIFEHVKGVTDTQVGYAGGSAKTAHYERIEQGDTGHAESIKITYDPAKITYGQLLKIYFSVAHDPTTLNRQHNDVGTQYRSSIFYQDEEQKKMAEEYIQALNSARVFRSPIVTKVTPLEAFYPAEAYHQHYLDNNPTQPYIANVDIPLQNEFKKAYPELWNPKSTGSK